MDLGRIIDDGRRKLGLSVPDTWMRYFGLGGNAKPTKIARYLAGEDTLPDVEHDKLAHAVNEEFSEAGANHPMPYANGGPSEG